MDYVFPPHPQVVIPTTSGQVFPVRRIYCIARNYADHTREMGGDPVRDAPFFFSKPATAIVQDGGVMPYPSATQNLHHEVELVVALAAGGRDIAVDRADDCVFGYAVGLDMTRRDLQAVAKAKGQAWDMAKGFDYSAPCSAITPKSRCGVMTRGKIALRVGAETRQVGDLGDMLWSVAEIISQLSRLVELHRGDLIFTGTPAGVGPVDSGDRLEASVEGLAPLRVTIG
jgi:fumarylpyruvate hydrolase